jgi:CBS-domain-containing membrane protein
VTDPEECGIDRQVREDEPALKAFRLMRRKGVGGIPVVDDSGRAVGSIMIKDVKHLLTASENRDYRSDFFFFLRNDYRSDIDGLHDITTFQKHC